MISRRHLIASLAMLPLAGAARLDAQGRRVGGARILLRDSRVWIQARFGDHGPYPMVIDTGTFVNLIREDLARELRLRRLGELAVVGVGGRDSMTRYQANDVAIGNLQLGALVFAGYGPDLAIHREAAGALSTSVLTYADSDLDFEAGEWRIYPDGRGERSGYELLPSRIVRAEPGRGASPLLVDVTIGAATFRLQVDTGAPGQILLEGAATRRSGLWDDSAPYSPRQSRGIGGAGARGRLVRVPEATLGGIRFERALVALNEPGSAGLRDVDGLIGLELLERLNLSTDLRAGRLWARRNSLPARPERYGLSGLWVEEGRGGLVVDQVSPRSPASEAGLQAGDVITGVTFADLVRRLGGRPGEAIDIAYRRSGGEARSTRLTLRPFL